MTGCPDCDEQARQRAERKWHDEESNQYLHYCIGWGMVFGLAAVWFIPGDNPRVAIASMLAGCIVGVWWKWFGDRNWRKR